MKATDYQSASNRTLITLPDRDIPQDDLCRVLSSVRVAQKHLMITEYLKKAVFHQRGLDYARLSEMSVNARAEEWRGDTPYITTERVMPLWVLSGLIGEAGEIAEIVVEYCLTGRVDKDRLKDEAGDCLWYVSSLCTLFGLDLGNVMQHNVEKLKARYPKGYSHEDAIKRA